MTEKRSKKDLRHAIIQEVNPENAIRGKKFSKKDLKRIAKRLDAIDGVECRFCDEDRTELLEKHHVVPQRMGGSDQEKNLITVCRPCHQELERIYKYDFFSKVSTPEKLQEESRIYNMD